MGVSRVVGLGGLRERPRKFWKKKKERQGQKGGTRVRDTVCFCRGH